MLERIRKWMRKKQELKRERIAALIACILRDKTNEQSWIVRDIESEYVDAFIYLMKGDWKKALSLVGQIKYTPPDPINCRCTMITIDGGMPEGDLVSYVDVDRK